MKLRHQSGQARDFSTLCLGLEPTVHRLPADLEGLADAGIQRQGPAVCRFRTPARAQRGGDDQVPALVEVAIDHRLEQELIEAVAIRISGKGSELPDHEPARIQRVR